MTVVPLEKKCNCFDYNGFVVYSDKDEIFSPNYIILSNGDNEELEQEVDYYDTQIDGDSFGIYVDLNDLNKLTTWYGDDDRVLF